MCQKKIVTTKWFKGQRLNYKPFYPPAPFPSKVCMWYFWCGFIKFDKTRINRHAYFISSNSPSGGTKLTVFSELNLVKFTHWWKVTSSSSIVLPLQNRFCWWWKKQYYQNIKANKAGGSNIFPVQHTKRTKLKKQVYLLC
jgi:hypothetical protein